jgi:hypothetical protein
VLSITFPDAGSRRVELRVRDADRNEDEQGDSTLRDGRTNYFIFPGETGADASWLCGEDFRARVEVTFDAGGRSYAAGPFELVPHEDHGHDH